MKMIKLLICTLVAIISFQSFAQIPVTPVANGQLSVEEIANRFAVAPMEYGRGYFYFKTTNGGVQKQISANFTLQRKSNRWGITQLAIGGEELPIDPKYPLWEFPPYTAGEVRNFELSVQGYDKSDNETRRGWFYQSRPLASGDEIKIIMELSYVDAKIPFKFSGDHNANNTGIQDNDGHYSGLYDSNAGAFIVGYDPLRPPTGWIIFDRRNNSVIGTAPFKGPVVEPPVPDSGTGFALNLPENLAEISLTRDGWSEGLSGLKMDQVAQRGGTNYLAKVMVVSPRTSTDYLLVYGYNLRVGTVLEVYGVLADGLSKLLGSDTVKDDDWSLRVIDATGYIGYRAVFIGAVNNPVEGFTAYAYSSSWPQGDDGGGKGRPENP